ncbi:MAG: cell surface protein SprA [Saprospiraceae bacterium]|nr:cell surface protein SprA [Saprospiraceae bacterium]
MNVKQSFLIIFLVTSVVCALFAKLPSRNLADPYTTDIRMISNVTLDTIPLVDRKGDYITDKQNNPFDITTKEIVQKVEYDPISGQYVIMEKIGNEYYRTPTYMTFEEYMAYIAAEQEKQYFSTLAGIKSDKKSRSGRIDPMDKVDLTNSLIDRLFGGTEVNIQPQGSVDLSVGWLYSRREDPNLPINAQRQSQPDFPTPLIKMNVNGKIGKKLDLDFNYDTQSTFDFDRQIKLAFDSDAFSEDDIIKKIEAGNVSLPLRGNLIQGAQSLFGLKTELQFGRLRLTGLVSQQKSKSNNIKIENGVSVQEFMITPNEYDENRHFFLSHYNRSVYEKSLENIPYIGTSHQIAQIEVWISDDRPEYQDNSSMVAAIADLAEPDKTKWTGINVPTELTNAIDKDDNDIFLPYNEVNDIYAKIKRARNIQDIDEVAKQLEGPSFGLKRTRDFELFRGRRLNSSEFTYHPKLGTISLNIRLRPNQVLGVAYNYYYTSNGDEVYQVGQISNNSVLPGNQTDTTRIEPPKVHFVKLLKSTNQVTTSPMWDLMMKNVYNLRTSSINQQDFEFDIFYEDDRSDGSLKRYMPDYPLTYVPILQLLNLDRLNRVGDPQSDGFFDYIPGVTVIEKTGSVVIPVLEPFGSHFTKENIIKNLPDRLKDAPITDALLDKYKYQQLYDTTVATTAHTGLIKNKFRMVGKVKSTASNGEIYLGPFVPQGSVRVNAGGKQLVEGQDYEIDYSLGRLRIINPAFLAQGTPINVSFEDNSVFSLQQKVMMGLRAEYQFSKKSSLGATFLRLSERPITQKVNIGDDPIKNRIFGLDYNYNNEAPWISKLVDKLPFYSTAEKSNINFTAEVAGILPGHANGINLEYKDSKGKTVIEDQGIANLDDFEGAITNLNLGGFNANQWSLASTPSEASFDKGKFKETKLDNNLAYNANRALINWSALDLGTTRTTQDLTNPYTRVIQQTELFTNRQVQPGQQQLFTFDLSYYPSERGPYNFDSKDGIKVGDFSSAGIEVINNQFIKLNDPKSRWGGIQRYFQNSDFETANYESIEFWMLNPFMSRGDTIGHAPNEEGKIVINLGSVSEDVMKDNLLYFENAMPTTQRKVPTTNTVFGRATVSIPLVNGFDIQEGEAQDLGFDGMNNAQESQKYQSWLSQNDLASIPEIVSDPSNDDFKFFNSVSTADVPSLLDRMKKFNGPEGNAPLNNGNTQSEFVRGNRYPDTEDINNNKTLDQTEAFYEYVINVKRLPGTNELDTSALKYFRQTTIVTAKNGSQEKWYRVQIPINAPDATIGGIQGFRGIQFMRMYMTDFETPKTFRLADFQLQRSIWRKQPIICNSDAIVRVDSTEFSIDDVGIEENSGKLPFNYKTPAGAIRTRAFGQLATLLQDERSMAFKFKRLSGDCEVSISKLANVNLALYKRLQMFVHAENVIDLIGKNIINDREISIIVRLGKDFPVDGAPAAIQADNNYYEYELPLKMSVVGDSAKANIWPDHNYINIPLDSLLALRRFRIQNSINSRSIIEMPVNPEKGDIVRMVGNPSLGAVKVIHLAVKNRSKGKIFDGEVWVNELRVTGYNEEFAWAAQSRLQVQMADLGELNFAANYSSNGFGGLDKRLHERSREEKFQYDIAANIDAGKLLPKALKLTVPVYTQYQKTYITPEFDPIDQDIRVKDKLDLISDAAKRDSIAEVAREEITIKTFNLTNVKINSGGTGKPWSPSNLGISYAYTENTMSNPIIKEDKNTTRSLGLDYVFARKSSYIEPLKFIKVKALKILSDFNFSLLPSNFSFTSRMIDQSNRRTFRQPVIPIYAFDDNRFNWERNYVLDWDLTKSLRFGYRANTNSIVDQLRYVGVEDRLDARDLVDEKGSKFDENGRLYRDIVNETDDPNYYRNKNLKTLGRSKNYQHNVSLNYKLPFKSIPILDWITAAADYKGEYAWDAGSLITIDTEPQPDGTLLGNTIRNGQNASVNMTFDFTKLYNKSSYLKSIETGKASRKTNKQTTNTSRQRTISSKDNSKLDKNVEKEALVDQNDDKKKGKEEKKNDTPKDPSMTERVLLRPLMMVRSVKINLKDDRTTNIPGFMPQSNLLGLSEGFTAPGWDFVAGVQPRITGENNWLYKNQDWFNTSTKFNDGLIQTKRQTFDAKLLVEPFKDFSVDVTFKKNYQETHNEVFRTTKDSGGEFLQLARFDVGSYDASFYSLNTLFDNSLGLYNQFKDNREVISRRLPNIGNPGVHPSDPAYAGGYGPTHTSVTVPAFIAAYTRQSAFDIDLDQQKVFASNTYIPKPNWQLNYTGLGKLKMFKKHFSNITIKHGYSSTIRVSRFETSPLFDADSPFTELSPNSNYYSRLEVPSVSIQEQFVPVLGVSIKTIKDLKFDFDFKMTRSLELGITQLRENKAKEITVGAGYVIKNFKAFGKKKKKNTKKKKKTDVDEPEDGESAKKDGGLLSKLIKNNSTSAQGRDVRINLSYSLRDDVSQIYDLLSGIDAQADRGQKTIKLNPTVEYDVNKNLALRFYFDYARTVPRTTLSFPTTTIRSGVTLRFSIN